eukprot:scaffold5955_cov103-Isochrysis_galbana.AAC.2
MYSYSSAASNRAKNIDSTKGGSEPAEICRRTSSPTPTTCAFRARTSRRTWTAAHTRLRKNEAGAAPAWPLTQRSW